MMEPDQTNQSFTIQDDKIDLKELFDLLWEGRKLIILITFVFALGSIFYALSLSNHYKSQATVSLASQSSSGGGSNLSRFNGLASMAGIAQAFPVHSRSAFD